MTTDILHTLQDKVLEILLGERFTSADDQVFLKIVGGIPGQSIEKVVIDMSQTGFVDSSGLSMLLIAREICDNAPASLTLRKPHPELHKTLRITHLDQLFIIEN